MEDDDERPRTHAVIIPPSAARARSSQNFG
jgi:hypothetical protein